MTELCLLRCSQKVLLRDAEYERAAKLAMALLRHLHAWGPVAEPPAASTPPGRLLQLPDPLSTAQAVLALLSSLTKRHSIALLVGLCSARLCPPPHTVDQPSRPVHPCAAQS